MFPVQGEGREGESVSAGEGRDYVGPRRPATHGTDHDEVEAVARALTAPAPGRVCLCGRPESDSVHHRPQTSDEEHLYEPAPTEAEFYARTTPADPEPDHDEVEAVARALAKAWDDSEWTTFVADDGYRSIAMAEGHERWEAVARAALAARRPGAERDAECPG
jgi:hypothetical protein